MYGPLGDFPVEPDVILMWLTPRQAMIFNEATGTSNWTSPSDKMLGRPACAALPAALNESQPKISLGCEHLARSVITVRWQSYRRTKQRIFSQGLIQP